MKYDIVIIGASFSGLTLAHHLPRDYKILVLDKKPYLNANVESTGLITEATKKLLSDFVDVDSFIPNKINTICVVSPDYDKYFFSHTKKPWIYSTDTPNLLAHMAQTLPLNVTIKVQCLFHCSHIHSTEEYPVTVHYKHHGKEYIVVTKFLVGADGAHSTVALQSASLSLNKRFLAGLEKVYYGNINFGNHSENTVYHFWFGEFSLGYGGWLSPTVINGKPAFRIGLAKLKDGMKDLKKLDHFIQTLVKKHVISIEKNTSPLYTFGSFIPLNGVLKNIYNDHTVLLGDAAGFCGAFSADGIKGAIVSGKVVAQLLPRYLNGNKKAFLQYKKEVQKYQKLIRYYYKQKLYRWVWDRMHRDQTFHAMYDLIEKQKDDFLHQFCDSKDKAKSLLRVVLKWKNFPQLVKYGLYILVDMIFDKK